jgi:C1A family cysteine protease
MPPVKNQGHLGCCTGFAINAAVQYDRAKIGLYFMNLSELFLYYNERDLEGNVGTDSGASVRDGFKVLNKLGVCSDIQWPYIPARFAHKPSDLAYKEAANHVSIDYAAVPQTEHDLKATLAAGFPVVFGIDVFESFMSSEVARTGVVPMPAPGERRLGGHCILLCGYDDAKQVFTIHNSWGKNWGDQGYFTLPYAYVLDEAHAMAFWVVRTVK